VTTLVAVIPSVGVLFLFWIALRAILQADRRERLAQARLDAAEDAAAAAGVDAAPEERDVGDPAGPAPASGPGSSVLS